MREISGPYDFRLKFEQVFNVLSEFEKEALISSGITHAYKPGETIFREGSNVPGIFYIRSGIVKKFKTLRGGGEQIFVICAPGEVFGYHPLLSGERYPYSATAIATAEVTLIDRQRFQEVLEKSVALSQMFLKTLGNEFSFYVSNLADMATKSVGERLASTLLLLDEKFRLHNGTGEITLSRTDLASMVGTAKETLVRTLQKFQSAGLIEKNDRMIKLIDRNQLLQVSGVLPAVSKQTRY